MAPPVTPPGERDFLMCGSPRSGTTLLCAALFQPPGIVTFMEPWDGMRLPPAELFPSMRREIESGAIQRGKLDVPTLTAGGTVRWWDEGTTPVSVEVAPNYLVGVKWPAFWQYLGLLPETKFLVTVRHPHETISSYKKKGGALLEGLDYPIAFNRRFNDTLRAATRDEALRRILLYEHINQEILRYVERPNVLVVRYERWFEEPEALVKEISEFLDTDVRLDHVSIRRSSRAVDLTEREIELIRRHCASAVQLGYDLDAAPSAHP
jgi:hypothetical protein